MTWNTQYGTLATLDATITSANTIAANGNAILETGFVVPASSVFWPVSVSAVCDGGGTVASAGTLTISLVDGAGAALTGGPSLALSSGEVSDSGTVAAGACIAAAASLVRVKYLASADFVNASSATTITVAVTGYLRDTSPATIANGYTTLAQLKAKLLPEGVTFTDNDTMMTNIINAVSRWIDAYCGRIFYTTASETRYYTPTTPRIVVTDDIATITSVKLDVGARTYPTTLAVTDYDTIPDNTTAKVTPIMGLVTSPNGAYSFYPSIAKSVQIVGTFGVPASCTWLEQVREACEIQCARIYKRKDSPFGVAGPGLR